MRERERERVRDQCVVFSLRRATTIWYWPHCVSVCEANFKLLVRLLDKYQDIHAENPAAPFSEMRYGVHVTMYSTFVCAFLTRSLIITFGENSFKVTSFSSLVK